VIATIGALPNHEGRWECGTNAVMLSRDIFGRASPDG
jgi:hypothetical protein